MIEEFLKHADWNQLEKELSDYLLDNSDKIPKRWQRFIAMYYPNSMIRRMYWEKTSVALGSDSYLNPNVCVVDNYSTNEVLLEIGKNCSIAPGVVFAPYSSHNNSKSLREKGILEQFEKKEKIIIGDDVWIGANCTIAPGITIGNHCIIGANSYVNKNIPDNYLAYGSPVRLIKKLF